MHADTKQHVRAHLSRAAYRSLLQRGAIEVYLLRRPGPDRGERTGSIIIGASIGAYQLEQLIERGYRARLLATFQRGDRL